MDPDQDLSTVPGAKRVSLHAHGGQPHIHALLLLRLGFSICLLNVLRCREGALCFMGLPCSAHVFMSMGTTGKNRANPRGDMTVATTKMGNLLAARTALLICVCLARKVFWGIEQPASSVAPYLQYLDWVININRAMSGFSPGNIVKLRLVCIVGLSR